MEKERFRKLFPHVAQEMESGDTTIHIDQFRVDADKGEKTGRKWAGYNPDAVDFIRRCETDEQAEAIITYMEERGEVSGERAAELRNQLRERGVRIFGERKRPGFYHENR